MVDLTLNLNMYKWQVGEHIRYVSITKKYDEDGDFEETVLITEENGKDITSEALIHLFYTECFGAN